LQGWWGKGKKNTEPLYVTKMVWLFVAPYSELIFKFKPKLVIIRLENLTTSSLGLNLKINPQKVGTNLEQSSTVLGTCKGSNSITLAHQTCKLELELCVTTPCALNMEGIQKTLGDKL
jgi:hypothetical protein